MSIIKQHIRKIKALCMKHNVNQLFVFGSVLTKKFNKESDIDFVVDFNEISLQDYADNYFNLKDALESILNRNIDLLENQAIRNPYLKTSIDDSKQLIYG